VFGEAADLVFGDAKDLGNFGKGAAGLECRKPANHRGMCRSIFFENQINNVIFAVMGEINIDVRQFIQRHAFTVEETAKIKVKADGQTLLISRQ